MYDVCLVLEQVVDALDDAPFPEHDLVPHRHEPVLHVRPQPVYKVYAPVKEVLEKFLLDVSPVGKYLSIEFLCEDCPYPFIPVINVCSCKTEGYDFSTVIAH